MAQPWLTDPESLPIVHGGGFWGAPCVQQKVALVHAHRYGYLNPDTLKMVFTDHPCWQNAVVNTIGIAVNDSLPVSEAPERSEVDQALWDRLGALVPRLLEATKRADPVVEQRINARLLIWLARWLHREVPATDRTLSAIAAREAWLRGERDDKEVRDQFTYGDIEAYTLRMIDTVNAGQFVLSSRPFYERRADPLIDMLEELLDQWAKACAEEGAVDNDGAHAILAEAGLIEDATPL